MEWSKQGKELQEIKQVVVILSRIRWAMVRNLGSILSIMGNALWGI